MTGRNKRSGNTPTSGNIKEEWKYTNIWRNIKEGWKYTDIWKYKSLIQGKQYINV